MVSVADGGSHAVKVSEDVCGHDFATGIHLIFDTTGHSHFLLYRKDRLRRSLELKNARTEAGTTTRRSLD